MKTRDYKPEYFARLRNSRYARGLLSSAFDECVNDGSWQAFGFLLQDIIEAQGTKKDFAKRSNLSRAHLYRLFGAKANPSVNTLIAILSQLGLRLSLATSSK